MARGAPSTAPSRQRVLSYLTPRIQDSLFFEEYDKSRSNHPIYGTPHPRIAEFPDHMLCYVESTDMSGDFFRWWYISERESQDTYNWEFTKCDIGGTKFDAVTRTYVTLRSKFDPATPAAGAAMPNTPLGLFTGTFVLAERKEVRTNDPKLDSLFVIDQHTYIKKVALVQNDYDEKFGANIQTTQTLWYATEHLSGTTDTSVIFADDDNAFWGLQSSGIARDGKALSAEWYVVTERQVVPAFMLTTGRSYNTTVDHYWPGVLHHTITDLWPRRDGGDDNHTYPVLSRNAYRGPCAATVTEKFFVVCPTPVAPDILQPLPVGFSNPIQGLAVDATLHAGVTFTCATGSNHPVYDLITSNYIFPATNEVDWPATVIRSDEVHPFRGGWLQTTVEVQRPGDAPVMVGDANYITVRFSDLTPTYDTTDLSPTLTFLSIVGKVETDVTATIGEDYEITFDNSHTVPFEVGTYDVVVFVRATGKTGVGYATFTIGKRACTLVITNTTQVRTGTGMAVTVTPQYEGVNFSVTYDGSASLPTEVGTYDVLATVTDANHSGSQTATFTITPAE